VPLLEGRHRDPNVGTASERFNEMVQRNEEMHNEIIAGFHCPTGKVERWAVLPPAFVEM
jgi:hypothetical protein